MTRYKNDWYCINLSSWSAVEVPTLKYYKGGALCAQVFRNTKIFTTYEFKVSSHWLSSLFKDPKYPTYDERILFEVEFGIPYPPDHLLEGFMS